MIKLIIDFYWKFLNNKKILDFKKKMISNKIYGRFLLKIYI